MYFGACRVYYVLSRLDYNDPMNVGWLFIFNDYIWNNDLSIPGMFYALHISLYYCYC
jgi:hypothetical protein